MRLFLRQAVFLENKILIGFQVDTLMFQVNCSSLYHHSSNTGSGNISGWRLVYVHCGGACYGFSLIVTISPVTIFFWDTTLPSDVSLSSTISALFRMCVPGKMRSVRVYGDICLAGLLGWVGLIDQLCCSSVDISRGAWTQDT